jgi:hypothetical protein
MKEFRLARRSFCFCSMAALYASEVGSSGVQAVEEYKIARGKRALPFGLNRSPALSIWAPELPNSCNS